MEYSSMRVERDGALARLIFTQPERGNPIDGDFCSQFCDVANELSHDTSIRAVLVTAQGKAFSYGGDVSQFLGTLDTLPLMIKRWTSDLHAGIARMMRMDPPVVVALQGMCAGGMAGVVAGADIIVAEPDAKFHAAYAGIAYCNDAGSSITLTQRMGMARAKRYIMMNETLDAKTALEAGLIDEIVAADQLAAHAEKIARKLAAGPTKAYGEIRRLFASAMDQPLDTQMELEAQALARASGTADAREGIVAFSEKRKPVFKGE